MSFLRRLFKPRAIDAQSSAAPASGKAPVTAPLPAHASLPGTAASDLHGSTIMITPAEAQNGQALTPPEPLITPPTKSSGSEAYGIVEIDPSPTPTAGGMFGVTRPLPPLEAHPVTNTKHLVYGLTSDIGQQRSNNQDSLLAFFAASVSVEERPDVGLFTVADGMGGHHDGEKASAIAVRTVAQHIIDKLYLELLAIKGLDADRPTISEILSEAIQKANAAVSDQVPEGGTTLTVAVIMGDLAYIGHVGDSRAYLITDKDFEQLTRDHSLVQRLVELDQLTPEEAMTHPQHNVLYRAIGQSENLEVDGMMRRLPPGSRLLLCSDGLWNLVPQELLIDIVRSASSPQEACDRLIATANARGGLDNITAVLIQMPG